MSAPVKVGDYLDTFARSMVREALAEASREYWLRRAYQLAGVGTPRCDEIAAACRAKAELVGDEIALEFDEAFPSDVENVQITSIANDPITSRRWSA